MNVRSEIIRLFKSLSKDEKVIVLEDLRQTSTG